MGVFDKLAYLLLERLLKIAESGGQPNVAAWLHKLLASGEDQFQRALRELVKARSWETCKPLLSHLIDTDVGEWIPAEFTPRFTFIDLERDPKTNIIREFAIATVHPFDDEPDIDELVSGGRGSVPASDIVRLFSKHKAGEWVAGHNIREFDAAVLSKIGVPLPDGGLLDTLELSLILDPLKTRHDLNAEHSAQGDVKANIFLFWTFDKRWMNLSHKELDQHIAFHDPASGLGRYLRNVAQRQQPKRKQRATRTKGRSLDRLVNAMVSVSAEAGREAAVSVKPERQRAVSLDEAISPITAARYVIASKGDLVVVPSSILQSLRRRQMGVTGSRRLDCTWSIHDQLVDTGKIRNQLGSKIKGTGASYMLRWLEGRGRLLAEIHPSALSWLERDLEQCLKPDPTSFKLLGLTDHPTWLKNGGSAIVLGAELLEEAAGLASGPSVMLHEIEQNAAKALLEFVRSRTLRLGELRRERLSVVLSKEDRKDPLFKEMVAAFANSKRPAHQRVSKLINTPPKNSVAAITCRVTGEEVETVIVETPIRDRDRWLRNRLKKLRPEAAYICGPYCGGLLGERLSDLLGVNVERSPAFKLEGLQVAEDGSLGSLTGIGRSMMAAAKRLILEFKAHPNTVPTALGLAPELQQVMVEVLKSAKQRAHAENTFGNRRRTIERFGDDLGYILLADSRPEPLPSQTRQVLVRRLPFPAKSDPDVHLAVQALPDDGDPFKDVILPRLLRRLVSLVSVLREQGVEPLLLDKRALVHTGYRRAIEAVLGETKAVAPVTGLSPEQLKFLSEKIDAGLLACGLRKDREAFADVDPDPVLRKVFGPEAEWRHRQREIVSTILKGEDVFVVMPTGGGKSACFQVPAIIFGELADELTVIISPLIALMRDQVNSMKERGVWGVSTYNSGLDQEARLRVLQEVRTGWTSMLYLAPEQLLNPMVREALFERGVRLMVIDEAHCMSEWGHDFRPEYRKIGQFLDDLALERGEGEQRAQIAAFTATASKAIQKDVTEALKLTAEPMDLGVRRPEIFPHIRALKNSVKPNERIEAIIGFLKEPERVSKPGIIYATTRNSTEDISGRLKMAKPKGFPAESIEFLHARVSDRESREGRFFKEDGDLRIIVSTTVAGMGMDKSDVKWVIHADAPGTVEAYAQEMGRAAREPGMEADTLALVSPDDLSLRRSMARSADEASVIRVLHHLRGLAGDTNETSSVAMLSSVASVTGLEENLVSVCLFHLERVGILKIHARVSGALSVKLGPKADEATSSHEKTLVAHVTDGEHSIQLNPADLAKDMFADEKLSIEECDRLVRSMVKDELLERVSKVEIEGLGDAQGRAGKLDHWSDGEGHLVALIEARFERAHGGWIRLTPRDQFELVQSAQIEFSELHHIISEWRACGLVSVNQDIFNLSLLPGNKRELVKSLNRTLDGRCDLLEALEGDWDKNDTSFCERNKSEVTQETSRYLSDLAARGILRWSDLSSSGQGFKFEWLSNSEQDDEAKLGHLNLHIRRRSVNYRMGKLDELFGKDRGPDEIWKFIEEYFASDERIAVDPKTVSILKEGLTEQQRDAVDASGEAPLLINAGAGTGKTHVLARRVLRLQAEEHLEASRTLVLSFSRSGSRAIGKRVRDLAKQLDLAPVQVRTFHSLCFQMMHLIGQQPKMVTKVPLPNQLQGSNTYFNRLRYNSVLVDLFLRGFSDVPMTGKEGEGWGKTILDYGSVLDSVRSGHPELPVVIVRADELDNSEFPDELSLQDETQALPRKAVLEVFQAYERELENRGLVDYAAMVSICLRALRTDARIRQLMQARIAHLLVDEFQDTSRAQEEIMRFLVGPASGLTVVGDNDQTIFTFNGSDVSNILEFAKRNEGGNYTRATAVVPLEENFRCTARILSVAGRVIALNKRRLKKKIVPASVNLPGRRNEYRERNAKVLLIGTDTAQDALEFAARRIQKWLEEGVEPHEVAVLSRINPGGNSTNALLDQLGSKLGKIGVPVADTKGVLGEPRRLIKVVMPLAREEPDHRLDGMVEGSEEDIGRWFRSLKTEVALELIDDALERGINTVGDWLEDLEAAVSNPQEQGHATSRGVNLKTIHGAKGEEYRKVIALHLDDTIFPPKQSKQKDEEEERRLLYVALTRAEEEAIVTGKAPRSGEKADSFLWDDLVKAGRGDLLVKVFDPTKMEASEEDADEAAELPGSSVTDGGREDEISSYLGLSQAPSEEPTEQSGGDEVERAGQPIQDTRLGEMFDDLINDDQTDD